MVLKVRFIVYSVARSVFFANFFIERVCMVSNIYGIPNIRFWETAGQRQTGKQMETGRGKTEGDLGLHGGLRTS